MLSRRRLLGLLTAGIAAAAVWRLWHGSDRDAIVAIIRKRLDYLDLDDAGLDAFATDLVAAGIVDHDKLMLVRYFKPIYWRLPIHGSNIVADRIRHGEERTISLYLLSSDFFVNGEDESCKVRYLGYYDPLKGACANPFARLAMETV